MITLNTLLGIFLISIHLALFLWFCLVQFFCFLMLSGPLFLCIMRSIPFPGLDSIDLGQKCSCLWYPCSIVSPGPRTRCSRIVPCVGCACPPIAVELWLLWAHWGVDPVLILDIYNWTLTALCIPKGSACSPCGYLEAQLKKLDMLRCAVISHSDGQEGHLARACIDG